MIDQEGVIHIPSAIISALFLGPGVTITHEAIRLIGESGTSIGIPRASGGVPWAGV